MFTDQGAETWRKVLLENFDVKDSDKLNWVSQYATIHEIHEQASVGVNNNVLIPNANAGVSPSYATPLNTMGMGNPAAPSSVAVNTTQPSDFWKQTPGSGDIPVSTLPMALNIALLTIGLELVPVIPAKGPWVMLSYMDFPYGGGKLGRFNETALDGIGAGKENKPIYIKVKGLTLEKIAELRADKENVAAGKKVEVKSGSGSTMEFEGKFISFGRMDGCPLVEVVKCKDAETSIVEAFAAADHIKFGDSGEVDVTVEKGALSADFVQTSVDFVDGFANFATGKKEAMTRAQNETGTGNVVGLRLFSKWVQVGSYEVTGTVTRQQLQDLPLYGVDAQGKIMEVLQNEITQSINARLLERVFALGVTNALQQKAFQNLDLNLHMGTADTTMAKTGVAHMTDIYGVDHKATWGEIKNAEVNTSAENLHTRQRRIASRILAAANAIQTIGRRGRATWVVTNAKVATALQDCSGYVVAPMVNGMAQDGSQNLFLAGSLAGLKVYVDPYMAWDDTRVCVGRKGDGNSPGVVFMPYILADTVSITAEGTMAPKMLVNSRYAIAEAGFYPETQYLTFVVDSPEFEII